MKRIVILALLFATSARADWNDGTGLPVTKADRYPLTDTLHQFGASDANAIRTWLSSIYTALRAPLLAKGGFAVLGNAAAMVQRAACPDNQRLIGLTSDATGWSCVAATSSVTLSGDVTGASGANTVVKIQGVPVAAVTANGDLMVGATGPSIVRVPVGANGTVLTADLTQTAGVKWAAAAGGGGASLIGPGWNGSDRAVALAGVGVGANALGSNYLIGAAIEFYAPPAGMTITITGETFYVMAAANADAWAVQLTNDASPNYRLAYGTATAAGTGALSVNWSCICNAASVSGPANVGCSTGCTGATTFTAAPYVTYWVSYFDTGNIANSGYYFAAPANMPSYRSTGGVSFAYVHTMGYATGNTFPSTPSDANLAVCKPNFTVQ